MHDTVSYDGINLNTDDFMELKKVFSEKLNQGPQFLSLNINKNDKLIGINVWQQLFYLAKLENLQLLLGSLLKKIILSASCEIS